MLKPRSFGKVLVGTALLLPAGMLTQTAVAQAQPSVGTSVLASYSQDDGTDDGADGSDELRTRSARPDKGSPAGAQYEEVGPARSLEDIRNANQSGTSQQEPEYDPSLLNGVSQLAKSIVGGVVGAVAPEGGPFDDDKGTWFNLFLQQFLSAASQTAGQVGQAAQNTANTLTGNQPEPAASAPAQPDPAAQPAQNTSPSVPTQPSEPINTPQTGGYNPTPDNGRSTGKPGIGEADGPVPDGRPKDKGNQGGQGGGGPR